MEQNVSQNDNRQPCFRKAIGNTTYVVRVHFCETSNEIFGDKIKRLIREETMEIPLSDGIITLTKYRS